MASYRISPPRVWPEAARAPRPPESVPSAREAHRQTGFVLGGDVDLVLRGLELESGIAAASTGPKLRTETNAAILGTWSRAWLMRLEALHAAECGNYVAATALVRAAVELVACAVLIDQEDGATWSEWLESRGVERAPALHATEFRLHPFRAAEVLAANEALGRIYRASNDLSMGHFGATVLFSGAGSDTTRLAMTFGDRDFHMGLAELVLGWLIELGVEMLESVSSSGRFVADSAVVERFAAEAQRATGRRDRCRLAIIEHEGETRYLIENVRRAPGGAPGRIVL